LVYLRTAVFWCTC